MDARATKVSVIRRQIQSGEYRDYLDRSPDVLDAIVSAAAEDVLREEMARGGEELPPVLVGQGVFAKPYWPKPAPNKFLRGFAIAILLEAVVAVAIFLGLRAMGWV